MGQPSSRVAGYGPHQGWSVGRQALAWDGREPYGPSPYTPLPCEGDLLLDGNPWLWATRRDTVTTLASSVPTRVTRGRMFQLGGIWDTCQTRSRRMHNAKQRMTTRSRSAWMLIVGVSLLALGCETPQGDTPQNPPGRGWWRRRWRAAWRRVER
jgi:hypothetical protein